MPPPGPAVQPVGGRDARFCAHVTSVKGDGLGAQLMARLSVLAYAWMRDATYVHNPLSLTSLRGHEYNMTGDMVQDSDFLDAFFNLGGTG
jgi:hypothetical protein